MLIPTVIETTNMGERAYDIYSRLLKDRIVFVGEEINPHTSNLIVAQLLHLAHEDDNKDIYMYINSPGGEIYSGMAILDTMKYIKPNVTTIAVGMAASMASILLAAGTKGQRFSLPNSRIMIHQPHGGTKGQAVDIEIGAKEILDLKRSLEKMMSEFTGKPLSQVSKDMDRDYYMNPVEAKKYGIIDKVITSVRDTK